MKIYFDENFSPHFIRGLALIQKGRPSEGIEIKSIKDEFEAGTPDETWIPKVAQQHGIVVTQDLNLYRLRHQWEQCQHYKLGIFFLKPQKKGWKYWDIIKVLINNWTQIQDKAKGERRPFGYVIAPRKAHFDKLPSLIS